VGWNCSGLISYASPAKPAGIGEIAGFTQQQHRILAKDTTVIYRGGFRLEQIDEIGPDPRRGARRGRVHADSRIGMCLDSLVQIVKKGLLNTTSLGRPCQVFVPDISLKVARMLNRFGISTTPHHLPV
jgi:hypothetical protein